MRKLSRRKLMSEYFRIYFLERAYGDSYIITQITYAAVTVLMLSDISFTWKGILKKLVEIILCIILFFFGSSIFYAVFGDIHKNWLPLLVFIVCYAVFRCPYRWSTKVIMTCIFYTSTFLNIVISEPWGDVLRSIGYEAYTSIDVTAAVNVLLFIFIGWYLKRFSTDKFSFIPSFGVVLMGGISAIAGFSQILYDIMAADVMSERRMYNMLISTSFLLLELLAYYMFYVISKEYARNSELLAMQRKAEIDTEMYRMTKNLYQEISAIRHEVKNHDAYMRALLEKKEYDKLERFLESSQSENREIFQYVNCGNSVINTIVNYEASAAKAEGIRLEAKIAVPPELPYSETELSSLLFNLLNNAIEAVRALPDRSDESKNIISLSIRKDGTYLFIRVKNPVDESIPVAERLRLKSTKMNQRMHGYGTKVVEMIAEKYKGHVKYSQERGSFTADVMMEAIGNERTVKNSGVR